MREGTSSPHSLDGPGSTRWTRRTSSTGGPVYNATSRIQRNGRGSRTTWSTFNVTLADGRNGTQPYTFRINDVGLRKVQFLLFKDGDLSSAFRELHLYVRVTLQASPLAYIPRRSRGRRGYSNPPKWGSAVLLPPTDIRTIDRSPCGTGSPRSGPPCQPPLRTEPCRLRGRQGAARIAMRWSKEKGGRSALRVAREFILRNLVSGKCVLLQAQDPPFELLSLFGPKLRLRGSCARSEPDLACRETSQVTEPPTSPQPSRTRARR